MKKRMRDWRRIAAGILAAAFVVSMLPVNISKAEEGSTATDRELLGMTLAYAGGMDESKYTPESYAAFTEALAEAQEAYDANALSDDEFYALRDELEAVKAALVFLDEDATDASPLLFRGLTVDEIVAEMGTGWNLGNTMDGHTGFTPNETLWQNVETTKALMRAVHDYGFNTVRIPITWGTMIRDEDYSIDETWMSRVQDIVDYAIAQDMYVIINVHHDGAEQTGWLRVAADDIDPVYEKFEGVWRTIAMRFRDYDEHLIFESMNEVQGDMTTGAAHDTEVINNLNQIFVNVVRSTGSNNSNRFLSVPGRYTNITATTNPRNGFRLPTDTVENRLFVAVHYYDLSFGLAENTTVTYWTYDSALSLQDEFQLVVDSFTSQGIPVILGEYGCINKNNPLDRAYHVEVVNRICAQGGIVPVYWDQGWYDRSADPMDFSYTLIDRKTLETVDGIVTEAIMRGRYIDGAADLSDIVLDTTITQISGIDLPDAVSVTIGDSALLEASLSPANTNDVLLWSTDDPTIATVYNGNIRGRGIGTTMIHAYAQSGTVEKTIEVTVYAQEDASAEIGYIRTAFDYEDGIMLEEGKHVYLEAVQTASADSEQPVGEVSMLNYKSSDESIATVSTTGKVVAIGTGSTYITITAANGLTKVIPVTVTEAEGVEEIRLSLNVYFNDEEHNYFSNEVGQEIRVTEEGQYEVTFDCATDLSANATAAGVTGLNNLTAVYIKDQAVTEGSARVSPLASCNIFFNSVVVDGVSLTVTQTEPKSALKASGIFDTNDPLNSWDGSQVAEVTVSNHVLNIEGVNNPQKITVTFTLSDMVFAETTGESAEAGTAEVNAIQVSDAAVTNEARLQLEISVDGTDGAKLTVVPANAAIAAIDTTALTVEGGKVTVPVTALTDGSTTVTVYANNGVTASFELTSQIVELPETDDGEETAPNDADDVDAADSGTEDGAGQADASAETSKTDGGTNWLLVGIVGVIAAAAAVAGGFLASTKLGGKSDQPAETAAESKIGESEGVQVNEEKADKSEADESKSDNEE